MWNVLITQLTRREILWTLFIINLLGTIYGLYWYKNQLLYIGSWLNIFVPDSPTASGFFTIVLAAYLLGKRWPVVEAFAVVTLIKYGIWAVVMIILGAYWDVQDNGGTMMDYLHWTDWMLLISHSAMAIQAVLFGKTYTYRIYHIVIVAFWTILNDVVDYTLNLHPWLPQSIVRFTTSIGWFTFCLSIVSLAVAIWLIKCRNKS